MHIFKSYRCLLMSQHPKASIFELPTSERVWATHDHEQLVRAGQIAHNGQKKHFSISTVTKPDLNEPSYCSHDREWCFNCKSLKNTQGYLEDFGDPINASNNYIFELFIYINNSWIWIKVKKNLLIHYILSSIQLSSQIFS